MSQPVVICAGGFTAGVGATVGFGVCIGSGVAAGFGVGVLSGADSSTQPAISTPINTTAIIVPANFLFILHHLSLIVLYLFKNLSVFLFTYA
jgi:hypothetical protein